MNRRDFTGQLSAAVAAGTVAACTSAEPKVAGGQARAGSPSGAGAEITALMSAMYEPLVVASKAAARRLG